MIPLALFVTWRSHNIEQNAHCIGYRLALRYIFIGALLSLNFLKSTFSTFFLHHLSILTLLNKTLIEKKTNHII